MRHRIPAPFIAAIALVFWHLVGCGALTAGEATSSTQGPVISCPAGQVLVSFQRGASSPGPVADAGINSASPTVNSGTNTAVNIGLGTRAVLIRFDVSSLPAGATVASATLGLVNNLAPSAGTVNVSSNGAAWIESGTGSVTWSSAPTYGATIASQGNSGAAGSAFAIGLPVSTVQGWITGSNYGLRLDEASGTTNVFASEFGTTANRPRLDVCYTITGPTCSDLVKNGVETAVDCGGGTCPTCANGLSCGVNTDCTSGLCTSGTCAAPSTTCSNGVLDTGETDIDCGGPTCSRCVVGKACITAFDCVSEACDRSALCVTPPTGTLPAPVTTTPTSYQYGPDPAEWLTIYPPPGVPPASGWSTMVAGHGGGATSSGGGRNSSALAYWGSVLNAEGIAMLSIDYPLVSGTAPSVINAFPAQLDSTRRAACFILANAAAWGIDPMRIGWTGFSYGGNLVALLVKTRNSNFSGATPLAALPMGCSLSTVVAREVLYYPNVDMTYHGPAQWSAYTPNAYQLLNVTGPTDPAFAGRAADATAIPAAGDPPLYITDGDADTTVSPLMVRAFARAARAVGVSVYDMAIPGGGHGASPTTGSIYAPETAQTNVESMSL